MNKLRSKIALLVSVIIILQTLLSSAAIANSEWWNVGQLCDSVDHPGSYQLGIASLNGVIACGPGSTAGGDYNHIIRYPGATVGEFEWECVEYSMRYMYIRYGIMPWSVPSAAGLVYSYPGNRLVKVVNNGASLPTPGDIVSMSYDHTAVIAEVNVVSGSGSVKVIEQNYSSSTPGYHTIAVTNGILQDGVLAWLHDPNYISDSSNLVLRQGNAVNAKKGLQDPWTNIAPNNAASMKAGGDRFAYFSFTDNKLYARQGLSGASLAETGPVDDYAITPSLLVVRQGTTIAAKTGLSDFWTDMFYGANNMTVSGSRIAFVDGNSNLWVKDGLNGQWYQQTYVTSYVITPKLIVVRQGGNLSAKTTPNGGWTNIWTNGNATSLRAVGNRITFADPTGNIYAKQDINGTWFNESGPFDEYAVTSQLFVVRVGSNLYAKAGLNDLWSGSLTSGAANLKVGGSRITFVDGSGIIQAKDGINGEWVSETGPVNEYTVTSTVDD